MNLTLTARLDLKAASGNQRRFSILAYSGGLLPVDGFPMPVVVDLSGLNIPGHIPILIDHTKSVEATLGVTDSIENDGSRLVLAGIVTGQSDIAKQVLAQHDSGHHWQSSIGAMIEKSVEVEAGKTVTVNGQKLTGPFILATKSTLRETSVLPQGADYTTSVNLAASAAIQKGVAVMPETKTFDEWTAELGIQADSLSDERKAALQLGYEAEIGKSPELKAGAGKQAPPKKEKPKVDDSAKTFEELKAAAMADFKAQLAAEQRHHAEVQAKAAGHPEIAATAIEKGWSIDKVELEVLKASQSRTRPTSFNSAQNSPENLPMVIEASLCVSRGIKDVEKQFDDKILQAAHTTFRRGVGLQQMFLMAASANGMYLEPGTRITTGNLREVLEYTFPNRRELRAAASTLSLPGILSNVANKEILQGYMEEDSVWRMIAQIKSVSDFKTVTSYRMLDDMEYEKLGPDGKIKHGTTGEESFTRSVDTYAKMYSLTRRDIINDDLSALDDLRSRVGRGGAIKLNDLYWTTFLANTGTIWTAARTNYISGSTTNLGTDGVGLGLGVKAWRQRRSPSGDGSKRISGTARYVLVPPELETIADQLYVARNVNSVAVSSANTHAGKYQPIVANQLSDSAYTGYSTTAWYLMGDPGMGAPVVVSFLNGQETPTVESADADFDNLGVQFRGYHDFGCDLGDGYLNSVMSKGAA